MKQSAEPAQPAEVIINEPPKDRNTNYAGGSTPTIVSKSLKQSTKRALQTY